MSNETTYTITYEVSVQAIVDNTDNPEADRDTARKLAWEYLNEGEWDNANYLSIEVN